MKLEIVSKENLKPIKMNRDLFKSVTNWQVETFGQATAMSKIAHLKEEIEELNDELFLDNQHTDHKRLEFADCFILLFGAAASDGMTYEDICKAIEEKMVINKARKWGTPDKDGVVNHIKCDCTHQQACEVCAKDKDVDWSIIQKAIDDDLE